MTDLEKVRLLIGDTGSVQFTDAQITAFLEMGGSVYEASALALEAWAATLTESLMSEKIGDYAYTKREANNKMELAARYRNTAFTTPAIDWAEPDLLGVTEV